MSGYLLAPLCFGLGVTYYALMRKDLQLQEQNRVEYAEYVSHILKDTEDEKDGEKEKEEKEQALGTGDQIDIRGNNRNNNDDIININNLDLHAFNVKGSENQNVHAFPNSHSRALRSRSLHNLGIPLKSAVSSGIESEANVDDMYGFPLRSPKVSMDSLKPLSVSNTYLKTKLEHLIWEDRKDGLNLADSKLKLREGEEKKEEVENVVSRILLKGKDSSIERIPTCSFTAGAASKENSFSLPSSLSYSSTPRRHQFSGAGRPRINHLFTIPVPVTPWRPKLPTVYQTNMALIQYDLPLPSSLSQTQQLKQMQGTSENIPTELIAEKPMKKLPPKPQTKLESNPPQLPPRRLTKIIPKNNNNNYTNANEDEIIISEVYENFKYLDVDNSSIQTNSVENEPEPILDSREIVKIENEENFPDLLKSDSGKTSNCDETRNNNESEIDSENETETDRKTSSTITVIHNPPEISTDNKTNPSNSCPTDANISTTENKRQKHDLLEQIPLSQSQPQESNNNRTEETEETTFCENSPSQSTENDHDHENNNNNNSVENLRNNNYSPPDSTHFLFSPPSPLLKSDSVVSLCLQNPIADSFSSSFINFECSTANEVQVDDDISINNENEKEKENDSKNDSTIIIRKNNNEVSISLNKWEEKSPSSRLDYLHLHELCVQDILQEIQSRKTSSYKIGIKRIQSLPDILQSKHFQPEWHNQKITECNIGISKQFYRQLVSFLIKQCRWPSSSCYSAWLKVIMTTELFNNVNINISTFSSHSKSVVAASVLIALLVIIFSWIMTSVSNPTVEKYSAKSSWHW